MSQNDGRIKEELKQSKYTHIIMLSHERLFSFPEQIFQLESLDRLQRLDLSFNHIQSLPTAITQLTGLKELWLQSNPIKVFPEEFEKLTQLEVVDIRNTLISRLPPELATLKKMFELDWRETPAATFYLERYILNPNDMTKLREVLLSQHTRQGLETELFEMLSEHFVKEADDPSLPNFITTLVDVNNISI